MNRLLRARVPRAVLWTIAGLLLVGCIGSCGLAVRPYNGVSVTWLELEARSALPPGSSREQVKAWLEAKGLPHRLVQGKDGSEWYLVRMQNGSWMWPNANFWMQFDFDLTGRLGHIGAGQERF